MMKKQRLMMEIKRSNKRIMSITMIMIVTMMKPLAMMIMTIMMTMMIQRR